MSKKTQKESLSVSEVSLRLTPFPLGIAKETSGQNEGLKIQIDIGICTSGKLFCFTTTSCMCDPEMAESWVISIIYVFLSVSSIVIVASRK